MRGNIGGLDASKLQSYAKMIADGYASNTVVAQVGQVSRWTSPNIDNFRGILLRTRRKKTELLDPSFVFWNMYFEDIGKAVANGERNYFFKALLRQAGFADGQLARRQPDFSVIEREALRQADAGFIPSVLFTSIDLFRDFIGHFDDRINWTHPQGRQLEINSTISLRLVGSHRWSPLEEFIIMSPKAGIWHVLPDLDTNEELAIAIGNSPSRPDEVEVIAETVAKYELRERKAVSIIQVVE